MIDPGHLLAAAGLAVFAGTFGALVGVGGGVVVVPALTILLGVPIKTAAAASLLGVIVTSLVAGSRYLEAGTVDRRLGLVLLAATSSGAVLGGFVANAVDATILSAVLIADPAVQRTRAQILLPGDPPSPLDPPPGCRFHTRCPIAIDRCKVEPPLLVDPAGGSHRASCHLVGPNGEAPRIVVDAAAGDA